MPHNPRIIVALDFPSVELAQRLVDQLNPSLCRLKVGNILFTQAGPRFVEGLMARGFEVFLDLKFHDIPQTVAGACKAAAELGVWMTNVHIQGGRAMLEAAVEALAPFKKRPLLLGVTLLTSLQNEDLAPLGIHLSIDQLVPQMAEMAKAVGLDGIVCSSQEAQALRQDLGPSFLLVTPGIRLSEEAEAGDQKRILTPTAALKAGSDYLVIGRPITQAKDPLKVLEKILAEIAG